MTNILRRIRSTAPTTRSDETTSPEPAIRAGVVEVFERRQIAGWLEVADDAGPVKVSIRVNDTPVATTWAANGTGRRVRGQLLQFRFALTDLWKYTKRTDRISIEAAGQALPIAERGTYYRPRKDGTSSLAKLEHELADGYVFGQSGRLQLAKSLDTEWQNNVLGLYDRVNQVIEESTGSRAFLVYGSLLGAIRDNGFIGHDVDFDCGYVSNQPTGQAAARELGELAIELIGRGFQVVPKRTCLAVKDEFSGKQKVDVYHLYLDDAQRLNFPFGVAGDPEASDATFHGVEEFQLAGHKVLVPQNAEAIVEYIYGANWRTPNPGFRWQNERTTSGRDGIIDVEQVDEIARANIGGTSGEEFQPPELLFDGGVPDDVIEIGSGLGHGSVALARAGKRVVGLERSEPSIRRAIVRAESEGLGANVSFQLADVYDANDIASTVAQARKELDQAPVTFFVRSFVPFTDRVLLATVESLSAGARPGDVLVADVRPAPAGRWPKDKSPTPRPVLTRADLIEKLTRADGWVVEHPEQGDDEPVGQVLARHV